MKRENEAEMGGGEGSAGSLEEAEEAAIEQFLIYMHTASKTLSLFVCFLSLKDIDINGYYV